MGKFILHYKGEDDIVQTEEKKSSNVIWFVICGIIGIVGVVSLIARKRNLDLIKKREEQI